jgi:hypothetical protein
LLYSHLYPAWVSSGLSFAVTLVVPMKILFHDLVVWDPRRREFLLTQTALFPHPVSHQVRSLRSRPKKCPTHLSFILIHVGGALVLELCSVLDEQVAPNIPSAVGKLVSLFV